MQQRRRRLRKRHLKSDLALLQTLSRLFYLVQFFKWSQCFPHLSSQMGDSNFGFSECDNNKKMAKKDHDREKFGVIKENEVK